MSDIESENGVVCTQTAWRKGDTVILDVPVHLLENLQAAWQSEDVGGVETIRAVRDLFDGEDGALQFLALVGIKTRPT